MNIRRFLLALVLTAAAGVSVAQPDISGTWAGTLAAAPNTTLEVHFVLTRTPDGYSAVLSSPTPNAIPSTPATSTRFADNRLAIAVDALSGRYEGTYQDGRFTGNWYQQGREIPLDLAPYTERELSAEAKDALRGSWVGDLTVPQANITLAIVLRFENNAAGDFVGFLDSPDQGANNIPISTIEYDAGNLKVVIPQIFGEYTATLAGETMDGTFTQLGQGTPLALKRGEYVARGQPMPAEAIERLEGSWIGRVTNAAGGSVAIVFRFEEAANGGLLAYLDIPEQGARNIPMTELMLDDARLSLVVPAAQASFTGTVSADGIAGTWAQGNTSQPVTMTRGEYTPSVTVLDIPAEAFERLAGEWRGPMGPLEIVFRFERTAAGEPVAFLDVPAQNVRGLNVAQAAIAGDEVTIAVPAVGVTVTGTLTGREIQGQWRQGQANNPLTLTRQ